MFAFDASSVAGEGAAGADDAVAGHEDGDRVRAVGEAHGAGGFGSSDALGKLRVADGGSARDVAEGAPDLALKRRAGGFYGNVVERGEISGEIAAEAIGEAVRVGGWLEGEAVCAVVTAEQAEHSIFVVGPVDGAEVPFVVGDEDHFADRGFDAVHEELQGLTHVVCPFLRNAGSAAQRCCAA